MTSFRVRTCKRRASQSAQHDTKFGYACSVVRSCTFHSMPGLDSGLESCHTYHDQNADVRRSVDLPSVFRDIFAVLISKILALSLALQCLHSECNSTQDTEPFR